MFEVFFRIYEVKEMKVEIGVMIGESYDEEDNGGQRLSKRKYILNDDGYVILQDNFFSVILIVMVRLCSEVRGYIGYLMFVRFQCLF